MRAWVVMFARRQVGYDACSSMNVRGKWGAELTGGVCPKRACVRVGGLRRCPLLTPAQVKKSNQTRLSLPFACLSETPDTHKLCRDVMSPDKVINSRDIK